MSFPSDCPHDFRVFGKFSYRRSEFEAARSYFKLALNLFNVFQPVVMFNYIIIHYPLGWKNSGRSMLMSPFLVITWVGYTITRVTCRRQDIIIIVQGPYFWKSLDLTMFIWLLLTATSVRCTAGELGNLGRVHHNQGHLKKARDYYNRARAIFFEKAWTWPCSCGNYLQQSEPGTPWAR